MTTRFVTKSRAIWWFVILFLAFLIYTRAHAAQAYYSPISINAAQVPSTQSNFPVLVSQTDARFKTTGNGGHVANSNGYDIRPYSDTGLTTALSYELERYNATTGEVVMWVNVASLTSSSTPIYLGYGDTGLTTNGSSTSTWNANFLSVLHLKDGTTLSLADSAQSPRSWTGNATPTAGAGQIDGAMALASASNQYIQASALSPAAMTGSAWIKGTTFPGGYNSVFGKGSGSVNYFALDVKSNGKLNVAVLATGSRAYDGTGSHTLSTGTWYHIALVYSSSVGLIAYVNGGSDGTVAANGALDTSAVDAHVGHNRGFSCCPWNGLIDEVRFSDVVRSADWLTTEYNAGFPATFETLGAEVAVVVPRSGWFMLFPN